MQKAIKIRIKTGNTEYFGRFVYKLRHECLLLFNRKDILVKSQTSEIHLNID